MRDELDNFDFNLENAKNMFDVYMAEAISIKSSEDKKAAQQPATPATPTTPAEPTPAPAQPEAQPAAEKPAATPEPPKSDEPHDNNPVQGEDKRENLDGNARKEMYQKFADVLKEVNSGNVFGSLWSDDAFKGGFNIVPYEMRYFYRLQNPVFVQVDDFKFIPYGEELLNAQEKYGLGKKMFVFATSSNKPVFYNMLDNKIYSSDKAIADTFDGFIDSIVNNNGAIPTDPDGEAPIGEDETLDDKATPAATPEEPAADPAETPEEPAPEEPAETTAKEEAFIDYFMAINSEYMAESAAGEEDIFDGLF
jgi:hypothetical protein